MEDLTREPRPDWARDSRHRLFSPRDPGTGAEPATVGLGFPAWLSTMTGFCQREAHSGTRCNRAQWLPRPLLDSQGRLLSVIPGNRRHDGGGEAGSGDNLLGGSGRMRRGRRTSTAGAARTTRRRVADLVGSTGRRFARIVARRIILPRLKAATHGTIRGLTNHGADQLLWRDGLRGVATDAVADAVGRPVRVIRQAGGKTLYKGIMANVVVNQCGELITAYATAREGRRWRFRR